VHRDPIVWLHTSRHSLHFTDACCYCCFWCAGEILLEKRYDGMSAADAHLQRISDHVSAYLQIVRSQLLATVPKAVVHCTVVPAKENLLAQLQEEVAGEAGG
jgi:hypothetical protein